MSHAQGEQLDADHVDDEDGAIAAGQRLITTYMELPSQPEEHGLQVRCEYLEGLDDDERVQYVLAFRKNSNQSNEKFVDHTGYIERSAALQAFADEPLRFIHRSFSDYTARTGGGRERVLDPSTGKYTERRLAPRSLVQFTLVDSMVKDLESAAGSIRNLGRRLTRTGRKQRAGQQQYQAEIKARNKKRMKEALSRDIAKWIQYTPSNVMSTTDGMFTFVNEQPARPEPAVIHGGVSEQDKHGNDVRIPPYCNLDDKFYALADTKTGLVNALAMADREDLRLVSKVSSGTLTITVRAAAVYDMDNLNAQFQILSVPAIALTLLQRAANVAGGPVAHAALTSGLEHVPNLATFIGDINEHAGEFADVLRETISEAELPEELKQAGELWETFEKVLKPNKSENHAALRDRAPGAEEAVKKAVASATKSAKVVQATLREHPEWVVDSWAEALNLTFRVAITLGSRSLDEAAGGADDFTVSDTREMDGRMFVSAVDRTEYKCLRVGDVAESIEEMIDSAGEQVAAAIEEHGLKKGLKLAFGK